MVKTFGIDYICIYLDMILVLSSTSHLLACFNLGRFPVAVKFNYGGKGVGLAQLGLVGSAGKSIFICTP